jgi:ribonuclease HII
VTPVLTAGIDEAGRGPLAGPVVAAAVILRASNMPDGLADSKTLSAKSRELLALDIRARALACSVAWSDAAEVDSINILNATMLAMRRSIMGLCVIPGMIEVDGNRLPDLNFGTVRLQGRAIIKGDQTVAAISAASILAKVARDQMMRSMDRLYPDYGFARHKGYGTEEHRQQIQMLGPCEQHRRSFRPVSTMNFGGQSD